MALKFLNKKGWHTGSLRNIENVWKAEQKHEAEQKKLEELRKQIHEERERSEFRQLQEQAGLVPKQERLDFLYDSGLAVGKGSSDGFKALESLPPKPDADPPSSSNKQQSSAPGALFDDKPQSANDAWRKLHSDPLLLIKQREQEALARVKNNPVQMAMIHKTVEAKKHKEKTSNGEKHHHTKSKHKKHTSSRHDHDVRRGEERKLKERASLEDESCQSDGERKRNKYSKNSRGGNARNDDDKYQQLEKRNHREEEEEQMGGKHRPPSPPRKRRHTAVKLSEEERAARLREMQMDAELHEEQRWKRLKQAEDDDAKEATRGSMSRGRNFLDAAHKSVYGAEKGGSATIEESVRRRTHYSQRRSEENAFRR